VVTITRILCPVDFSDCSRRALEYAVAIGCWYDASVTALHVSTNVPVIDAVPVYRGEALGLKDREPAVLRQQLEALAHAAAHDARVTTDLVEAADVQPAIIRYAEAIGADLIVMGTRGRSGVQHVLLGSVAEGVARHSVCPTMLVPPGATRHAQPLPLPFSRILCAVDFAKETRRSFDLALQFAEEADGHLLLLHALEVPPELQVPATMGSEVDIAVVRAAAEADALQHLRNLVPDEAHTYCRIQTDVYEGRADRAIVEAALQYEADLVVLGVRHHSALDRLVFATHTHAVLRDSPCPVLVVPAAAVPAVGAA
jgi:nucleotide-binding universal stress UspA family protein